MSKAALKKEFAGMTREQIIQIVLDAYAARKEVREYTNLRTHETKANLVFRLLLEKKK